MRRFSLNSRIFPLLFALIGSIAAAQTEKILYNFNGPGIANKSPALPLIMDPVGNLYGVAGTGDLFPNEAEVFQLVPNADGTWTENVLFVFPQTWVQPNTALVMDSTGNFFAASSEGGNNNLNCFSFAAGCGFIFELSNLNGKWTAKPVYTFSGGMDGAGPNSLVMGADGSLYGTADYKGVSNSVCDLSSCGSIYRLVKQANGWKFQLIHDFTGGADGGNPNGDGSMILDSAGNLYGASQDGGTNGLVFEFHNTGTSWKEKALQTFPTLSSGRDPLQGMVFDTAGNLYGITNGGGTFGLGTVFELTATASGPWKETVLYNFQGGNDGSLPVGPIVFDSAGNLYGTTPQGGASGMGTVWKLSPNGGTWTETVLHSFVGMPNDGADPDGGVIIDSLGNLYGVAPIGGTDNSGVAYEITP
jgi:uncharacterized repeat protein (TIGR03803 family)